MSRPVVAAACVLFLATIAACAGRKPATIPSPPEQQPGLKDVVAHFEKNGLHGKREEKLFAAAGAVEGFGYEGDGFEVELYRFADESKAKEDEDEGHRQGKPVYRRGMITMWVQKGEVKVVPIFNSFR